MFEIVDIHAHILPRLDDGAENMDMALSMVEIAVESGVGTIVATPHCNQRGSFENYASAAITESLERLRRKASDEGLPIEILSGMEVYGTSDVCRLLSEKKLLTINDSRYLLIEFGFHSDVSHMSRILYNVMDTGLVPVVAHPERYVAIQNNLGAAADWYDDGIVLQINKGSFFGRFGRDAYYAAHELTANGFAGCVASDAHRNDMRTTDMTNISSYLGSVFSEEMSDLLLIDNPMRIVKDMPLIKADSSQLL